MFTASVQAEKVDVKKGEGEGARKSQETGFQVNKKKGVCEKSYSNNKGMLDRGKGRCIV